MPSIEKIDIKRVMSTVRLWLRDNVFSTIERKSSNKLNWTSNTKGNAALLAALVFWYTKNCIKTSKNTNMVGKQTILLDVFVINFYRVSVFDTSQISLAHASFSKATSKVADKLILRFLATVNVVVF